MRKLLIFMLYIQRQWLGKLAIVLLLAAPTVGLATVVRMQTTLGIIDVKLYDKAAPLTVTNFLNYAKSGAYNNSFIHRSVPGFIIQGGGYSWGANLIKIPANPSVMNEFSSSRSNLRGTIAMAKSPGDPNSATSEWFFNLADNSANLDNQNGGFTVFGKVLNAGMGVVDAIEALPIVNARGAFSELPLATPVVNNTVQKSNLLMIKKVSVAAPARTKSADRVFSYLESMYPEKLSPAYSLAPGNGASKTSSVYYYRYYSKTKQYVAISDGNVYWGTELDNTLSKIASLDNLFAKASKQGY